MNVALLLKVKAEILAEPTSFDMDRYFGKTNCGTTACIAGHALLMSGYKPVLYGEVVPVRFRQGQGDAESAPIAAGRLLGLSEDLEEQLFHVGFWEPSYRERYDNALDDATTQAKIAAEYIDFFIQEHAKK